MSKFSVREKPDNQMYDTLMYDTGNTFAVVGDITKRRGLVRPYGFIFDLEMLIELQDFIKQDACCRKSNLGKGDL